MTDRTPRERSATRHDVALLAGVSDAVVSYTLNGGAPVAPATRERVLDAVAALGYRPNQTARALRSGSTRVIALILPTGTNPFFTELAHAVESVARAEGYALYLTTFAPGDPPTLDRLREFSARQVDGVLVVPGDDPLDAASLDSTGMPWAMITASEAQEGAAGFGVDLFAGAVLATTHLIDHGHRTIAFVGALDEAEPRRLGWERACADRGLEPGPAVDSPYTREGGYAAGMELIAGGTAPTAIFAASDMIAIGVLRALHERDHRIPDDLAVVSFDGSWESEYSWPALTAVRQPIERMARAAVDRLLERTPGPPTHTTFPGDLIVRSSCGPH